MTPALWIAIGSPLVALLGVLVGLWLGQRRWKSEQAQKERSEYDENLEAAYLELWDVVEDVHLKMRQALDGLSAVALGGYLADINSFMIRQGLYIQPRDQDLVLEYLFLTYEFLRQLVSTPAGREEAAATMNGDEYFSNVSELASVRDKADALRNEIRQRVLAVVGAPKSSGWNPPEAPPSEELKRKFGELFKELGHERTAMPTRELEDYIQGERVKLARIRQRVEGSRRKA